MRARRAVTLFGRERGRTGGHCVSRAVPRLVPDICDGECLACAPRCGTGTGACLLERPRQQDHRLAGAFQVDERAFAVAVARDRLVVGPGRAPEEAAVADPGAEVEVPGLVGDAP